MPRRRFDHDEAIQFIRENENMTNAQLAEHFGVTVSAIRSLRRARGLTKPQLSHKKALPWSLAEEHWNATPATYLRRLDTLAQGERLHEYDTTNSDMTNQVVNWANRILDEKLDIDYSKDASPSDFSRVGGFYTREANEKNWHLKNLMDRVQEALRNRPMK